MVEGKLEAGWGIGLAGKASHRETGEAYFAKATKANGGGGACGADDRRRMAEKKRRELIRFCPGFSILSLIWVYRVVGEKRRVTVRILIVEDNKKVAQFIVKGLREESYAVDHASDGAEGMELALTVEYDAIILDVMLPGMTGIEIVQALRREKILTPVLILTVKSRVDDKVAGLDSGADDYLTKPFSFDELLARLRALLRRNTSVADCKLELADLVVDCSKRLVSRDSKIIDLTPKEYALLVFLLRNQGRIMTRTSIIDHVWDMQYDSGTNIVDVLIRYLRRKLEDGYDLKLIHTIRGVGYVMKTDC